MKVFGKLRHVALIGALLATSGSVSALADHPTGLTVASPQRILDTRAGVGAPTGLVQPGTTLRLHVAGGAPDATAAMLNLTAAEAQGPGWVRAWPCDGPEPSTSVLNYVPGQIAANAVAVGMSDHEVCLSVYAPVHLIADVSGWFSGTDDLVPTQPQRILDTRETGDPIRQGEERRLQIAGAAGVPSEATLAALNLTVAEPAADGWVVAYPCGQPTDSSTVNFSGGDIVANLTLVQLSGGAVCFRSWGTVDLVVDVYGWSSQLGNLRGLVPTRLLDTRDASTWSDGPVAADSLVRLRVAGVGGVPNDAAAAMLTVTVADTSGPGFLTVWPCDQPMPEASTINISADQLRSNLALVQLSDADGMACIHLYSNTGSAVSLVVDAVGYELGGPTTRPLPGLAVSGGAGCGLVAAAFCDSFDSAHRVAGSRSGDLDPLVWGVSRTNTHANTDHGEVNSWFPATLNGQKVLPPDDVRVIDGQLVEAVNDGGGQSILAMYPKQPFNIDGGRTGTVVFDVSDNTKGAHAAWPELWWTDQPVPAPGGPQPTQNPTALNSLGISFARLCGYGFVGVDRMVTTKGGREKVFGAGNGVCVPAGSPSSMNHVEVKISSSRVQVFMSTGASAKVLVADESIEVPLVQGVLWMEDVHYNANKFEDQGDHQFTWDNFGFDGPKTYRDRTFDVSDAAPDNLGYRLQPDQVLSVQTMDASWERTPTKAYVTFNWLPTHGREVPRVRVNGGAWQDLAWPFDNNLFAWRTVAVPVAVADVRTGANTIEIVSHGDTLATNINLTLINAAPVP